MTQRISTWKGDIPPISHKHFKYQKFSVNLKVPPKTFSALSDEKRRRKFVIPPSRLPNYFFPLQKFSGKQKWQLTKISYRSCEAKFSRQNLMPPVFPVLCIKIVGKKFKHRGFPQRVFTTLWDKKIRRKNVITPPPLASKNCFRCQNIFRSTGRFPMNFPVLWSNKSLSDERDNLLSRSFNFCYQKIFEASKHSVWNFSAMWDQNISTEKRDIPPCIQKQISLPEFLWNNEEFSMKIKGTVTQRNST